MHKRNLAKMAPRVASPEEMQRFHLSDDRCFFFHATMASESLLVLSVYHAEDAKKGLQTPGIIVCFSKTDFINRVYDQTEERYVWRTSCLHKYFSFRDSKSFLDEPSRLATEGFFGKAEDLCQTIALFQHLVLNARLMQKHRHITDAIDQTMALVPPLPKSFEASLHAKAMPQRYIFYDYGRRKSLPGFCTNCRQQVTIDRPRHNMECACQACGAKVTCKSRGRLKHPILDEQDVCLPQKTATGFVLRFFQVWRKESPDGTRSVEHREYRRHLYAQNTMKQYLFANFKMTGHIRWCDCVDGQHPYDGWLYPTRLDHLMAGTAWQYCSPRLYLRAAQRPSLSWYLHHYREHPCLENLLKNGFSQLAIRLMEERPGQWSLLDGSKTKTHELLRVRKEGFQALRHMRALPVHLEIAQALEKIGLWRYDAELLREISTQWGHNSVRYVRTVLPFTSHNRAMRYAGALKDSWGHNDWLDYLQMAAEVGYDLRQEHALFPRKLKKAHEEVTWLHRASKAEASEEGFAPHVPRLKAYEWHDEASGYRVIAPEKALDIVHEGHRLNHCVHSYIDRVIDGSCAILFLRKPGNPSKPYITLEIQGSRLVQYRGANNNRPDEETCKVVERYQEWLYSRKIVQTAA